MLQIYVMCIGNIEYRDVRSYNLTKKRRRREKKRKKREGMRENTYKS